MADGLKLDPVLSGDMKDFVFGDITALPIVVLFWVPFILSLMFSKSKGASGLPAFIYDFLILISGNLFGVASFLC